MQNFAQLLLSSVGFMHFGNPPLECLFGSLLPLLLLHVFVEDENVKMGLIPGNSGQRSENNLLEHNLHFHT